ncbi:MAG: hypothetical protein FJ100_21850 [Deltaproteobacteria bacterium]|nr:hypothetical protein [Deltaproteobacteria bacterium]
MTRPGWTWRARWTVACAGVGVLGGCYTAEPPPRLRKLELTGTPYQRGVQHGKTLSSEIRSFYTTMLATSLLPYLNREQADISAVLKAYDPVAHPEFANGQFSLRLLTESAQELEKSIPQDYRDEMHGIADGAQVPYADVLLLNTFVDSTLATRSVAYYLRAIQGPKVELVHATAFADNKGDVLLSDAIDNDGDGKTDESFEALVEYEARPDAALVEVPTTAQLRVLLQDADGVDPKSVRLQLVVDGKTTLYTAGTPGYSAHVYATPKGVVEKDRLEVKLVPAGGLPAKAVVTLAIQASDLKVNPSPVPAKARTMRVEQFTFSTVGYGKKASEIANLGASDATTSPASTAFALRKTATADGQPLLAHHFTLLDAGTSHKHCVLQVHRPPGKPAFAFVGWAGIAYGFAGLSAQGLGVGVTHSDTLNNPLVARFEKEQLQTKLVVSGIPVGFALRRVLEETATASKGAEKLLSMAHTFGWNFLLADAGGDMRAVEAHSAVHPENSKPVAYGPEARDELGVLTASVGADDLAIGGHFRKNATDINEMVFAFHVPPQRAWSSYYYPSLRTQAAQMAVVAANYGKVTPHSAQALLRTPDLVDRHDSMQASVIEPAQRRMAVAAGIVPATDGPFETFTLPAWP